MKLSAEQLKAFDEQGYVFFPDCFSEEEIALPYHGSLSRERRFLLEDRLKAGELRALVTTSSLELAIDVGSVAAPLEGARRDYAVIIVGDPENDPEGLEIDAEATARARAERGA